MKLQLCLAMVFQPASTHRLESKLPKGRREEAPLITMIFVHHEFNSLQGDPSPSYLFEGGFYPPISMKGGFLEMAWQIFALINFSYSICLAQNVFKYVVILLGIKQNLFLCVYFNWTILAKLIKVASKKYISTMPLPQPCVPPPSPLPPFNQSRQYWKTGAGGCLVCSRLCIELNQCSDPLHCSAAEPLNVSSITNSACVKLSGLV